jgi:hypothetical protein
MVKRRGKKNSKKPMMMEMNKSYDVTKCGCNMVFGKLSAMAFILFLVIVWPVIGNALLSLHWGWYLGITIVLGALATAGCGCRKK